MQKFKLEKYVEDTTWMSVREGLKLRSVIQSKRISELATYLGDVGVDGTHLANKMIITRQLGLKHVMPGTGQWQIATDKKAECWRCGQHILALFLWAPRIGALTSEKD